MITRGQNPVPRETAQRFILQSVVALFAEDIELLPRGFFTELLNDCRKPGGSSYDLLGGLFRQMANKKRAQVGRFQEVDYFNGGLFDVVEPVDLAVYTPRNPCILSTRAKNAQQHMRLRSIQPYKTTAKTEESLLIRPPSRKMKELRSVRAGATSWPRVSRPSI
jgi:hypothetical protein